jgi:hypothetical protein
MLGSLYRAFAQSEVATQVLPRDIVNMMRYYLVPLRLNQDARPRYQYCRHCLNRVPPDYSDYQISVVCSCCNSIAYHCRACSVQLSWRPFCGFCKQLSSRR